MGGFTPINPGQVPSQYVTPARQTETSKQVEASDSAAAVAVAEYLGRSESTLTSIDPPPAKKGVVKPKKRTSNTAEPKKRRKSSTVSNGMPITKLARKASEESCTPNRRPRGLEKNPTKTKNRTDWQSALDHAVSTGTVADTSNAAYPVSVYTQSTFMDVLDSTSVRTSYDSVKAGDGRGHTLYQSHPPTMQSNGIVEFSQPWLDTALTYEISSEQAGTLHTKPMAPAGTRESTVSAERPSRKANLVASEKNSKIFSQHQDGLVPEVEPNSQLQQKGPKKQSKKNAQKTNENDNAILIGERMESPPVIDPEEKDFSDVAKEALVDVATAVEENVGSRQQTPPSRKWKQNMREVDKDEDYGGALLSNADRLLLDKFRESSKDAVRPVVRKPFQKAILDRSPIFGASNGMLLRTCFRLGEALNTGSQAVRCNNSCILEVYARVTSSWREAKPSRKQHFVFNDLYHDKPPLLDGTFELWDQAQLWDLDSKMFLKAGSAGIMCRAIARMKRDGQKWRLEILSIWEATWEDINYAAGIYADDVKPDKD